MKISARYMAVLDLMTIVFKDQEPADQLINDYFRNRRYIGSGDRRFISNKIWEIIRHRRRLEFDTQSTDPKKMLLYYLRHENLEDIYLGGEYNLPRLTQAEKQWLVNLPQYVYPAAVECECPDWLFEKINDSALLEAMKHPAPADFRVAKGSRDDVLKKMHAEGFDVRPTPYAPKGIRSSQRINLNNCVIWQEGYIEPQDEASQIAALMCDVNCCDKIIDYCSGAGGKALALAAELENKGQIDVHDINLKRLEALYPRMNRLGIHNIKVKTSLQNTDMYTRFIIDAPCSGTGTWRRSPDAKFRLTPQQLNELVRTQQDILEKAYEHTVVKGRIIYMTCSILKEENENNVNLFLSRHLDMKLMNLSSIWKNKIDSPFIFNNPYYLKLNPFMSETDGFFTAVMEKN